MATKLPEADAVLLGVGTAMVYPTLLAAIGDVAHPNWRARSVGVYRLWRDGGFAIGALLAGLLADAYGIRTATAVIAALTAASGLLVAARMYETHHPCRPQATLCSTTRSSPRSSPTARPSHHTRALTGGPTMAKVNSER